MNGKYVYVLSPEVPRYFVWSHGPLWLTWPSQQQWHRIIQIQTHLEGTSLYSDLIMSAMSSQITGVSSVCLTICSGADHRKYQSIALLVFVRGIHRWPVDSPHKGPVTRKMFPFDDVIMWNVVDGSVCQWFSAFMCWGMCRHRDGKDLSLYIYSLKNY